MKGNQHSAVGIGLFLLFYYLNQSFKWFDFSKMNFVIALIIVYFYSRLPDIDQEGSKINDWFILGLVVLGLYGLLKGIKNLPIISFVIIAILQIANHRTFIHSILIGAVLSLPLYFINPIYAVIGFLAFLAHLIVDNEVSFFNEPDLNLFKAR